MRTSLLGITFVFCFALLARPQADAKEAQHAHCGRDRQSQRDTKPDQNQANRESEGSRDGAQVITFVGRENPEKGQTDAQQKTVTDVRIADATDKIATLTTWLVIVGFAQGLFLWLAINDNRKNTRALQRAFVFVKEIVGEQLHGHGPLHIRVIWKNSGNTPTRKLRWYLNVVQFFNGRDIPEDFKFPPLDSAGEVIAEHEARYTRMFLGPQSESATVSLQVKEAELKEMLEGKRHIYAYGWAYYYDVFPGTKEHVTRFCYVITPLAQTKEGEAAIVVSFIFKTYAKHNCVDDECETPA